MMKLVTEIVVMRMTRNDWDEPGWRNETRTVHDHPRLSKEAKQRKHLNECFEWAE